MRSILPLLLLGLAALAPTASAETALPAVGPCQDPGLTALATCAYANGEDLACNAAVGTDDCVRQAYCDLYWVSTEDCWWPNDDVAATSTGLAFAGPCEEPGAIAVAECAAYNGEVLVCNAINGHDDCIRPQDAEKLVCNAVTGTDDCLPVVIAMPGGLLLGSAAIAIGPCDDPGAVALVECAEDNTEILVCAAIFGDPTTCITRLCQMLLDNCPLDLKGPASEGAVMGAAGLPGYRPTQPCNGAPGLIYTIDCGTTGCVWVGDEKWLCIYGLPSQAPA